jgi:UDP-glucose:(heptosyl)LPS alpha-1,3-glucosyltransferase
MKIAFIRKNYNPYGGAERFLEQLLGFLLEQGHEVHLFAHRWKISEEKKNLLKFHPVPLLKGFSFLQLVTFAYFSKKQIEKERFDVIYSFERVPCLDLYRAGDGCHRAWLEHRRENQSWWMGIRTYFNPLHRSILHLEKQIFEGVRTKLILCNSHLVKEEIQRFYNVLDSKIRVLHNGVDLDKFQPNLRERFGTFMRKDYGIGEKDLVLLFVGSGFERKGLCTLIQSLPLLKDKLNRNLNVIVIGKGKINKYQAQATKLGCGENVMFLGPAVDPLPWFGVGDIFVLPTLYDPFSNATLEALASGIPVITTHVNGASEILKGKGGGEILDSPFDCNGLASAVFRLSGEGERQKEGRKARDLALNYSMDRYVKETLAVFNEIKK